MTSALQHGKWGHGEPKQISTWGPKAAKKTIPRGYRNNYIPCWDAECESLYKTFLQSPQGDDSSLAATALLANLDRKQRDQWFEAVQSINFSGFSRKACSILNNLTDRS